MKNHLLHLYPDDMTPEERLDSLAEVFAKGFLYLAQNGLLESDESHCLPNPSTVTSCPKKPLTPVGEEGNHSSQDHGQRQKKHGS